MKPRWKLLPMRSKKLTGAERMLLRCWVSVIRPCFIRFDNLVLIPAGRPAELPQKLPNERPEPNPSRLRVVSHLLGGIINVIEIDCMSGTSTLLKFLNNNS